jgi:DNA polymerase I-like protein with 3'-5' exonuclease and polymerase domains
MKGFGGGFGRIDIWYGTLAENITQATAADFLRGAIVDLDDIVVLHTHDELVIEVVDTPDNVHAATKMLTESMLYLPEWADGLPLAVDIESGPFYTK